jgi:hypothetical protein
MKRARGMGMRRAGVAVGLLGVLVLGTGLPPGSAGAQEPDDVGVEVADEAATTTTAPDPDDPAEGTDATQGPEEVDEVDGPVGDDEATTTTSTTSPDAAEGDAPASTDVDDATTTTEATDPTPSDSVDAATAEVDAAAIGDIDNDGILDGSDNCQATFNPLQGNADLDFLGNACDPDFGEQDLVGGTIYENRLCQAITLAPNDDGSSQASERVFFPQALNFFGTEQRFAFVNNNGNITFVNALSTFTPFGIAQGTTPIIAPFFADVDTRPPTGGHGGRVTYGVALNAAAFGGRNVSCFTWDSVGYFARHTDKRNTFQLLIVDRSDVAPGDFDIYFNYSQLQWETGDASGGSNGFGGTPVRAGFSAGTPGSANTFFEFPCSGVTRTCLDTDGGGLRNTSTNSTVRGRHIFRVRGGAATAPGSVAGTVRIEDPPIQAQPLVNALVELCREVGPGDFADCRSTFSIANGTFDIRNVADGNWRLRVFPQRIGGTNQNPRQIPDGFQPSGLGIDPLAITRFLTVTGGQRVVLDLTTSSGTPPPSGVTFGRLRNNGFFPHIVAGSATLFRVDTGCGTDGTFVVRRADGGIVAQGTLRRVSGGRFEASVVITDPGPVSVEVSFPGCNAFRFDAYVDPSGHVVDQDGAPIAGARVVLMRSDFPEGPFTQVPAGSELMSPSNRLNPDRTEDDGFFGWDTLSGFYRVDASSSGCANGSSAVLPVPPEQVNLTIVLQCERNPRGVTTTTVPPTTVTTAAAVQTLARTGSDAGQPAMLGGALVVAGVGLVLAGNRRRPARTPAHASGLDRRVPMDHG